MKRREFLAAASGAAIWAGCGTVPRLPRMGAISTVRGPIRPEELGLTLVHEHVLVDFAPVSDSGPHRYDRRSVIDRMLPFLLEVRSQGVRSIVDATPAFLGRDPLILRALSEASGLHIVTNTGYYGARDDAHIPDHVRTDSVESLAARWTAEYRDGIDGTGIRPGFLKIGVDPGPLSEIDAKLVRAAGQTHLETGLTIAVHTGPAAGAMEQLDMLEDMGIHASAWIWVHAQAEEDSSRHVEAARRGAWVEFDGIRPSSIRRHIDLVLNMQRHGFLSRVLISQDAGWYHVGEEGGGEVRGYTTLLSEFVPSLREAGLSGDEVDQLVLRNPAEAFRVRVRRS